MRDWLRDLGAVIRRGWWIISLLLGVGVIGAAVQVGSEVYSHGRWQLPSLGWVILVFVGVIVAQQMVIADRRPVTAAAALSPDELLLKTVEKVTVGSPGLHISTRLSQGQELEIRPSNHPVELHRTVIQPPAADQQPLHLPQEPPAPPKAPEPKSEPGDVAE